MALWSARWAVWTSTYGDRKRTSRQASVVMLGEPQVLQVKGCPWTQFAADLRHVDMLRLARHLARSLSTRVFCLEATDDAYGVHCLFDCDQLKELRIDATNFDVRNILVGLGLELLPRYRDLDTKNIDQLEDTDHFGWRQDEESVASAEDLARRIGCYLHCPSASQDKIHDVWGLSESEVEGFHLLLWPASA